MFGISARVLFLAGGACLMALAFSLRHSPWLALLALLPLFRAIQVLPPAGAAFAGALWGVALCGFCAGISDAPVWSRPGTWALLALLPASYAALGAALTRRIGYPPFVLGVGWMLVELALRPLALRHGLLAGTAGNGWLLGAAGRTFGYVPVAFAVACASAFLLAVLTRVRLQIHLPAEQRGLAAVSHRLRPVAHPCYARSSVGRARPRAPPL